MPLRIIGDVHGQIDADDLYSRGVRPYLDLIADCSHSIQIGDMGDGETYDKLMAQVDVERHRFFPGNHDHYDHLPPHNLGDFGSLCWGGVEVFFIRGAASSDREKLIRLGNEVGKTLWYPEEELAEDQMLAAEAEYLRVKPGIVLTHDAPTEIARFVWNFARQSRRPSNAAIFEPSRTNKFLTRLFEKHAPRLWAFGHHHRDWKYREGDTQFVCVGELAYFDIDDAMAGLS